MAGREDARRRHADAGHSRGRAKSATFQLAADSSLTSETDRCRWRGRARAAGRPLDSINCTRSARPPTRRRCAPAAASRGAASSDRRPRSIRFPVSPPPPGNKRAPGDKEQKQPAVRASIEFAHFVCSPARKTAAHLVRPTRKVGPTGRTAATRSACQLAASSRFFHATAWAVRDAPDLVSLGFHSSAGARLVALTMRRAAGSRPRGRSCGRPRRGRRRAPHRIRFVRMPNRDESARDALMKKREGSPPFIQSPGARYHARGFLSFFLPPQ